MKYSVSVALVVSAMALGCSDERDPIPPVPADSGIVSDVGTPEAGASVDVSVDAPRTDGYLDLFDVFPLPDAGCVGCIADRCASQINACVNNPVCTQGLLCTVQMCAGGILGDAGLAGVDFVCVLGCFNGDQKTALAAVGAFSCVTMTCGSACALPEAGTDAAARPDTGRADGPTSDAPIDASDDVEIDTVPTEDAAGDTGAGDAASDAITSPDVALDAGAPGDSGSGNDAPSSD